MLLLLCLFEFILARPYYSRSHRSLKRELESAFSNFLENYVDDADETDEADEADDEYQSNAVTLDILPDWMYHLRNDLVGKKLNEIFLPGAHDTAMNVGGKLLCLGNHFKTQHLSVKGLLESGIRFLDLRVRMKAGGSLITFHLFSGKFAHGGIGDSVLLKDVMEDINTFLENHRGEVVIAKIKPYITGIQMNKYEDAVINSMPNPLQQMLLPSAMPINQLYSDLIIHDHRFIVIYEKTKNQIPLKRGVLIPNPKKTALYSEPPRAKNLTHLVQGLEENLPKARDTPNCLVLYHWTITGGSIIDNTNTYLSNKFDFQNNARIFGRKGKRVNVIMMDFCNAEKSIWVIEMNERNWEREQPLPAPPGPAPYPTSRPSPQPTPQPSGKNYRRSHRY